MSEPLTKSRMVLTEEYMGGLSSSAIARRSLFGAWVQGFGVYLTDRRIIATKVKTVDTIHWIPNAGAVLGTFGDKVVSFINEEAVTVAEIDSSRKVFEAPLQTIALIELKRPGEFFSEGYLRFHLSTGRTEKFGLLGCPGEFSDEPGQTVFEKLSRLFRSRMPELVKSQ